MNKTILRRTAAATFVGLLVTLAGCGSSSSSNNDSGSASVTITKAWARTSTKVAQAAAGYVTLESAAGDSLTGASVDTSIAGSASLHETVAMDSAMDSDTTMMAGSMGSDTTMAGAMEMTMRPVSEIVLEPGTPVSLAPGGYHIMLEELVKPLETGQKFTIELTFAKAGTQDVEFTVSDEAP